MFYRPSIDNHGLPHNPFKAIITPRPIGWISTVDADGRPNLAPYSFSMVLRTIRQWLCLLARGKIGSDLC